MQDYTGTQLAIGDHVAVAILTYKRVRLEVGKITAIDEERGTVKVTYAVDSRWANRSSQSVTRHATQVAKTQGSI